MVVGKVGLALRAQLSDLLDASLQGRIVWLDGDGEPAVRLGVFMATVDPRGVRKRGQLGQRAPHDRKGRFEYAAATQREERIAAEGGFIVLKMIGDMSERMPGCFNDLCLERPYARDVSLLHLVIEERNARSVLGRAPHLRAWKLCLQFRHALNVIGVMMGDEDLR